MSRCHAVCVFWGDFGGQGLLQNSCVMGVASGGVASGGVPLTRLASSQDASNTIWIQVVMVLNLVLGFCLFVFVFLLGFCLFVFLFRVGGMSRRRKISNATRRLCAYPLQNCSCSSKALSPHSRQPQLRLGSLDVLFFAFGSCRRPGKNTTRQKPNTKFSTITT